MENLVTAREAEERRARTELQELEELRLSLLESSKASIAPSIPATIATESDAVRDDRDAGIEKRRFDDTTLSVRVEQGLRSMIDKLQVYHQAANDESISQETGTSLSMQSLFESVINRIDQLKSIVTPSESETEHSITTQGAIYASAPLR